MTSPTPVRPTVPAVVCTRHRAELLESTIEKLLKSLRAGDELLVVESGEPHASAVLAAAEPSSVDARVLRSDEPAKSHKLNLAIREARGDVLVLTDDDVAVAGDWVDGMAAAVAADGRTGIAFGPVDGLTHLGLAGAVLGPGPAPLQTWAYAHGASMAVRKACALDVGGFDERLGPGAPAHGEEHDLVLRSWEREWHVVLADVEPVAHVEWRSDAEQVRNLLVYQRGAGAVVGAAVRRRLTRWWKYALLRLGHELAQFRTRAPDGRRLGWRGASAFLRGVVYGVAMRPQRFLAP